MVAGQRTLVLIAGPSGSGKSHLARIGSLDRPVARLELDSFYRNWDAPDLPRTLGIVDWDDVATWDLDFAMQTIETLLNHGEADVPRYEISISERVGSQLLDARGDRVVLAEGIFAADAYRCARERGLPVKAIWLDRSRPANFVRRLVRDLREHRKPPLVLLRRGAALFRSEPSLRAAAVAAGFTPMSMRQARTLLATLAVG